MLYLTGKPTFAKSDGYDVALYIKMKTVVKTIAFKGPLLDQPICY